MSSPQFEQFLNKVTSKVKSKEAHNKIKKELTNHLQELSQTFQNRDISKEQADEKAIQEMGNPFILGEHLNRLHRPKIDWMLIVLFIILVSISFLPLVSDGLQAVEPSSHFIGRQILHFSLAILVIISFLFFDYRKLKNWWILFYSCGLLIHFYLHLFGYMTNGQQKWIALLGFTVDGAMISLLLFFLAWAGIFHKINEFHSWKKQGVLFGLFWTPVFLYMIVPNLMFSIIYFFCIIAMFTFAQVQKKLALKLIGTNVVAGFILIIAIIITSRDSILFTRLSAFINPNADPNGAGYMYITIRNILSQAGWFGNGLYNDLTIQTLPDTHTDFVFPYLVYSFGWVFGIALSLILLLFITRISKNAFKTKDLYGRLLVIGVATLFGVPTIWNILMGFRLVPIAGISLPLISYGGTMLLFYAALLGLILSVYRRKDIVESTVAVNRCLVVDHKK